MYIKSRVRLYEFHSRWFRGELFIELLHAILGIGRSDLPTHPTCIMHNHLFAAAQLELFATIATSYMAKGIPFNEFRAVFRRGAEGKARPLSLE